MNCDITEVPAAAAPAAGATPAPDLCAGEEHIIPREEHIVSRRDIDPDALKVLYRLAQNNYTAYLVGGGVRDLLLGRKPKDFDISTNARPEQIRALFRNCILIGRRFRLAHIRYHEKIIETSTFRSTPKQTGDPTDPQADLFQRDDNLFGTPQEDALRRDFTVNGLFYDINTFSIIDYVGGMEDLAARRIRAIGDPNIRFREDPVRMVRAVRFASRLGFTLSPDTEEAIRVHGPELAKASPARLLEEITRLFAFSAGEQAVRLLFSSGLLRVILPEVADCLEDDAIDHTFFWQRLQALDRGDTVMPDATPALLFSVLLLDSLKRHLGRDWSFAESPRLRFDKVHAFLEPIAARLKFPRKLVDRIVHMFITQHRFAESAGRGKRGSITSFVTQDSFHEALALAELVLTSEGGDQSALNHWRDMLAERIYAKDDVPGDRRDFFRHPHGPDTGGNGNSGVIAALGTAGDSVPAAAASNSHSDNGSAADADDLPAAHGLSRSARRRRNKRLRRQQNGDERPAPPPTTSGAAPSPAAAFSAPEVPASVEATPVSSSSERSGHRNRRGGRRRDGAAADVLAVAASAPEAVAEEPIRPLTAAAFWTAPEPDPEPEPEAEPKKRGRRAKSDKAPAKAKAKKSAKPVEEEDVAPKPLAMDKADEADIPISWLDEI